MFCGECGKKNEKGAKFCEECGAKLQNDVKGEIKDFGSKNKKLIISICALVFVFKYISKSNLNNFEYYLYGILSGGICGNLFDRIVYGSVIDYLDFNIFGYGFPIFNFADVLIVISMFLIILTMKDDKNEV